jgi:excisionase family DNA binding protein
MSAPSPPTRWLNAKEAAEYLGVSQPTIFRWMKDGRLSFYRVGGSTRFTAEDLDAMIEKTVGSAEAEAARLRCAVCGHDVLVDGRLQGTGRLYFRPFRTRFWTFREAMVPTVSRVCAACGYIHQFADLERLAQLEPRPKTGAHAAIEAEAAALGDDEGGGDE